MIAIAKIRRATDCFVCGRQLEGGVRPNRYGVCLGEEAFSIHAERFIREHNAALDAFDDSLNIRPAEAPACTDSGRLAPDQAAPARAFRTGKNTEEA